MIEDDEMCFKLMDKCHICDKKYTDKDVRIRVHCHITGKFRGSAHQECSLKLRSNQKILRYLLYSTISRLRLPLHNATDW